MLDTVVCSCLQIGVMLVKKYAKYKSNMLKDIGNIWGSTQTLTFDAYSKWKRGHNYDKMLDRFVCYCLQVEGHVGKEVCKILKQYVKGE